MEATNNIANEVMKILSSPSVQAWVTSGLGWFAHYLYVVSKWERFHIYMLLINMLLAFWLWTVIYSFIPDSSFKGWIVGIAGFSTYPILSILEEKWTIIVEKYLKIKE